MDEQTPRPYALVPIEELIEEILSRFDVAIFGGVQKISKDNHEYFIQAVGSDLECIGLATVLSDSVSDGMLYFDEEDLEDEEEGDL